MRIDPASNPLASSQPASPITRTAAKSLDALTASATPSSTGTSKSAGVQQLDFTNMTRQEMRDWINGQVKSGAMSLEESAPFSAMTMKIPVGGGGDFPAAGDNQRIDFTRKINEGIQGALSRNDMVTMQMLQSALATTQSNQGRAIGIDMLV